MEMWFGLLTLTVLEIVLGIDNVISRPYPACGWTLSDREKYA